MKGICSRNVDWNARILFLRSKSNPYLYLLDKRGRFRSQPAGSAVPFNLINLANELLRIDLYSFFNEMASWHLYYRKYRPLYTLTSTNSKHHPLRFNSDDRSVFRKNMPCWKIIESTPYIDSVDGFDFKINAFRNRDELQHWRDTRQPVSPDFDTAISKALSRSSRGVISTHTKELLAHTCSICLRYDSVGVPDPLYYTYLFCTIAIECTKINELLALVCSDKKLIKRFDAAELFSSYLHIDKLDSEQSRTGISFKLTRETHISAYSPEYSFPNFFHENTSPLLSSHDLNYLQSLYAVTLQTCLNINKETNKPPVEIALKNLEEQTIKAFIDVSNRDLKEMPRGLDAVISLCSKALPLLRKQYIVRDDVDVLSDLLDDLIIIRASDFFCSLIQFSKTPYQRLPADASEEEKTEYEKWRRHCSHLHSAARGELHGPLARKAPLNDHEAALEQIKRQAIIRHAENTCLLETEWSFSRFYARLLSELLSCGKIPIRCKSCGSLFFPTGSNSQYCDRFDPATNLYCNPRLNEKKRLARKAPHGTAINLHKKAETAKQLNEKRRFSYFAELEEFVDHEIGPVYFKSTLITDELYQSWRAAINGPKNQPRTKTPEYLAFPHPVIWEKQVIDGNQEIAVYLNQYAYPALRDKLAQSAKSSKSSCMTIDKPTIRFGGWKLRLFNLLRLIASINNDKEHIQDGLIPVPGLGSMDALTPNRSPLDSRPEGKETLLIFPPSGKGRLILFELIDEKRSKQLHQDLTHVTPPASVRRAAAAILTGAPTARPNGLLLPVPFIKKGDSGKTTSPF